MKQLLVVLGRGDRAASSIVRGLAYRELLAKSGFSTAYVGNARTELLDKPPRVLRHILGRPFVANRLRRLLRGAHERRILSLARKADVVYLLKLYSHPLVHKICRETRARVVYDFVDAAWVEQKDPRDFNEVLRAVDAVTTNTEVVASYVRQFNANCTVIPDAPALEEFDKRRAELGKKADDRIILGWIGSRNTTPNLYVIWEALEELFTRYSHLHLRLVGAGDNLRLIPAFENVRFSCRTSYNQAEMIEEIFGMHIGLFPLQNVEVNRARGALKAANYMSGEAAVVTSPIGQCVDVIQDGVNGMLAGSTQEWIDALEALINDAELRRRLAQNGLATVRSRFRQDQSFTKLKEVLLAEGKSIQQ